MTLQNPMMKLLTLWIVGALVSGCAASTPNPWSEIQIDQTPSTRPVELGRFPLPASSDRDSVTYDRAGVVALDVYRETAEGNTMLADELASEVDALRPANAALVEAGTAQHALTELHRTILETERRHMFVERVAYWVVIIGLGAAVTD